MNTPEARARFFADLKQEHERAVEVDNPLRAEFRPRRGTESVGGVTPKAGA